MAFIFTNTNIISIKQKAFNCCGVLDVYFDESKIETFESHGDYDNRCNFGYCRNLRKVSFKNCHNLLNIGHNKDQYAGFALCTNLASIDFTGCENLTQLALWVGLSCSSLKEVNFTGCSSLQTIGASCFESANLQNVDLTPCTALRIVYKSAFRNNPELKTFDAHGLTNLEVFSSGSDYQSGALMQCPLLESVDFHGCTALTNLGGTHTFYNDKALKSANLEGCSSLTKFDQSTFADCSALTSLNITGCTSLESFEKSSLVRCKALESITGWNDIKATIKYFKESSFEDCIALNVDLSNLPNVISFDKQCFLRDVALDSTMENCPLLVTIGQSAFNGCTSLGDIDLHGNTSLTTIGNSAFQNAKAVHVNLNNCSSLTTIEQSAWKGAKTEEFYMNDCTALTALPTATSSYIGAWQNCNQLRIFSAQRCNQLTNTGTKSFNGCVSLEQCSFKGCQALTTINNYCFAVGKPNDYRCVFDLTDCPSLRLIEGYAFYKAKFNKALFKGSVIDTIGLRAFDGAYFKQVTIYDVSDDTDDCLLDFHGSTSLTTIDNSAFESSLAQKVDLSNCPSLTTIGDSAFYKVYGNG